MPAGRSTETSQRIHTRDMTSGAGDSIRVSVAGRHFTLDRDLVETRMNGVLPDPLHDHYVVVSGRRYPPKQVIALVTGVDRADFASHHARRILRRLGFLAGRRPQAETPPGPSRLGPHGGAEAELLRPYIGKWVAQRGLEVLVAADTPQDVVGWLHRHEVQADGVFRVPEHPDEIGGAGPY